MVYNKTGIAKTVYNLAADGLGKDAYNDPNQGHGTHVAGIVTQATPVQVKIMAVRVFDLTGSASYTTITLGVDYAVQHNADVINMSLGFEILPGFESDDTDLMDEAFARALKAGTTVCVASGNEVYRYGKKLSGKQPLDDRSRISGAG